jgi:hypothetical protein
MQWIMKVWSKYCTRMRAGDSVKQNWPRSDHAQRERREEKGERNAPKGNRRIGDAAER